MKYRASDESPLPLMTYAQSDFRRFLAQCVCLVSGSEKLGCGNQLCNEMTNHFWGCHRACRMVLQTNMASSCIEITRIARSGLSAFIDSIRRLSPPVSRSGKNLMTNFTAGCEQRCHGCSHRRSRVGSTPPISTAALGISCGIIRNERHARIKSPDKVARCGPFKFCECCGSAGRPRRVRATSSGLCKRGKS